MDDGDLQDSQAVYHASTEVDARRFLEIAGRAGDLGDLIIQVDDLRKHLIVEHEVFRVDLIIDAAQDLFGEGTVPCMVFGQLLTKHHVLEKGEGAVEKVFVQGHAAVKGALAQGPGAQH